MGVLTVAASAFGDAILVPISEVGSLAVGVGWLSACAAFLARSGADADARSKSFAIVGTVVSVAIVLMIVVAAFGLPLRTASDAFGFDALATRPLAIAIFLVASVVVAPVAEGGRVGNLRVTLEGRPIGEYPVVALESVPAAGIFGRAWDTLKLWLR